MPKLTNINIARFENIGTELEINSSTMPSLICLNLIGKTNEHIMLDGDIPGIVVSHNPSQQHVDMMIQVFVKEELSDDLD